MSPDPSRHVPLRQPTAFPGPVRVPPHTQPIGRPVFWHGPPCPFAPGNIIPGTRLSSSTNGAPLLPFRRGEKGVSRKPSPLITCQKSCTLHPPTFFSALSIHIPVQEVPAHYVPSSIQSLLFSWFSHPLLITPSSKENLRSLSMILPPNSHTIRNKRMKAFLSASPCSFSFMRHPILPPFSASHSAQRYRIILYLEGCLISATPSGNLAHCRRQM